MVARAIVIAVALATAGCGFKYNSSLEPTLHFHSQLRELRKAPIAVVAPRARQLSARVLIEPITAYYPRPIGLQYSNDGATRRLRGQYMGGAGPTERLTDALRSLLLGGDGEPVVVTGALVDLAVYRLGAMTYGGAALELRVVHRGHEIYTARYRARAQSSAGRGLGSVWPSLQHQLVGQLAGDRQLLAALEVRR